MGLVYVWMGIPINLCLLFLSLVLGFGDDGAEKKKQGKMMLLLYSDCLLPRHAYLTIGKTRSVETLLV